MKKLVNTIYVLLFFVSFMLSIFSMNPIPDKYILVPFQAHDGIVHIEKKNLPLIPIAVVCAAEQGYGAHQKEPKIITLPEGVSKEQMMLVNNALNARPDTFKTDHFEKLDKNKQSILINSSGWYKSGPKTMIISPEVIKRLVWACLPAEIIHKIEILAGIDKEKDALIRHCRKQLITNRSCIGLIKQPRKFGSLERVAHAIDLRTLFINGYFECDTIENPIPLCIAGKTHKTYAYNFISSDLECRVTERLGGNNSTNYLLWIIDHKNPAASFSEPIQHNSPIIGCCFSKTKTDVEYVITYSENDIIFSTITKFADGYDVKMVRVDSSPHGKNVAAAYCNRSNILTMGMYQGIDNVLINWNMGGTSSIPAQWPFKQHGLLEKIIIKESEHYTTEGFYIFGCGGKYNIHKLEDLGNNLLELTGQSGLHGLHGIHPVFGNYLKKNNKVFMCDNSISAFSLIEKAEKDKQQSSVWHRWTHGLIDDFNFVPDDECYKKYSASGEFILSNSLHKESGMLWVKTEILDSRNHKCLLSLDTLYQNFFGVGFDNEEKKLIFVHENTNNAEVSLWDDQDKQDMEWFEGCALKSTSTIALMIHLLREVQKNGNVVLKESDPVCVMLRDWGRVSSTIRTFLEKCFPLRVIKG